MEIPKMFYGQQKEVRARARKLVKQFEKGAPVESLDFGEMMDTFEVRDAGIWGRSDGYPLLLIDPDRSLASHIDEFHCYSFFREIALGKNRFVDPRWDAGLDKAFGWSLQAPWRLLGIAGQVGSAFLLTPRKGLPADPEDLPRGKSEWYAPFLRAALNFWDVLEAEGPRYNFMGGRLFSMTPTSILHVVGQLGITSDDNPLSTPGRTLELLRAAVAKLEAAGVN
jgi:hypothetical protein